MAEQEIIKHMEAIVKASQNKKRKLQSRLQEILLEIVIIVFAVSISIWFHNWAETLKDRKDARAFLTGLKGDLTADIEEMKSDRQTLNNVITANHYFERVGRGESLNNDSLRVYQSTFLTWVQIDPRISRFEALKGSGRLGIIENDSLLLHITDLYTKDFSLIILRNNYYMSLRQQMMTPYLVQHLELDTAGRGTNWQQLLRTSAMRIQILQGESLRNNIDAYDKAIAKCELIIKEIDEELH